MGLSVPMAYLLQGRCFYLFLKTRYTTCQLLTKGRNTLLDYKLRNLTETYKHTYYS